MGLKVLIICPSLVAATAESTWTSNENVTSSMPNTTIWAALLSTADWYFIGSDSSSTMAIVGTKNQTWESLWITRTAHRRTYNFSQNLGWDHLQVQFSLLPCEIYRVWDNGTMQSTQSIANTIWLKPNINN